MSKGFITAIFIMLIVTVGCTSSETDPAQTLEPMSEVVHEPGLPLVQADNSGMHENTGRDDPTLYEIPGRQDISIDYRDYDIDYETTSMNFHEFPLDKLVAYYLGGDGAYSYGASYELYYRFIANPDEVLEFIALVGGNIVRGEPAKVRLCNAIVSIYFFDDILNPNSFRTVLDSLEESYGLQSNEIIEILRIMGDRLEENIEEFNLR